MFFLQICLPQGQALISASLIAFLFILCRLPTHSQSMETSEPELHSLCRSPEKENLYKQKDIEKRWSRRGSNSRPWRY